MTLELLFEGTKRNVETLKSALTDEQKDKLDYATFQPLSHDRCLLGQLTGSANSDVANALLPKEYSASYKLIGVFEGLFQHSQDFRLASFDRFTFYETSETRPVTFAPVELFLMLNTNSNELYEYLKGQRDSFEPRLLEVKEEN